VLRVSLSWPDCRGLHPTKKRTFCVREQGLGVLSDAHMYTPVWHQIANCLTGPFIHSSIGGAQAHCGPSTRCWNTNSRDTWLSIFMYR
jgi:hypothetical protein